MGEPDLRPCPFCGCVPRIVHAYRRRDGANVGDTYHVEHDCDVMLGVMRTRLEYGTETEAIAAWNRTPPTADERFAMIRRLRDEVEKPFGACRDALEDACYEYERALDALRRTTWCGHCGHVTRRAE